MEWVRVIPCTELGIFERRLIATHQWEVGAVRVLCEARADANQPDHLGKTALHCAAHQGLVSKMNPKPLTPATLQA